MAQTARLLVAFHPIYEGSDLAELRRQADATAHGVAVLERLAADGWRIICTGADHGIIDYAAEREFERADDAIAAAAAAGALGHMLDWPGEEEYLDLAEPATTHRGETREPAGATTEIGGGQ